MTINKSIRAAIYCRTSNGVIPLAKVGSDLPQTNTIDMQRMLCQARCDGLGYEVVGVFTDANFTGHTYPEGFEITDPAVDVYFDAHIKRPAKRVRPGLGKLLRQDGVDVIVATNLSRLVRPAFQSHLGLHLWQLLARRGIRIITLSEGEIDVRTFEGLMIANLKLQISGSAAATPTTGNMYSRSVKQWNPFVGCGFDCTYCCLLYTSPSPRDRQKSRMPSSA